MFSQHWMFDDVKQTVVQPTESIFAEEARAVTAARFFAELSTGRFAPESIAVAASTVGAQFAALADTAQKLSDKVTLTTASRFSDAGNGETRLYDKVPQTDTENRGGDEGFRDDSRSGENFRDLRQSLYQRAQAVAHALGDKFSNPAVRELIANLEAYAKVAGVSSDGEASSASTVKVIV